VGINWYSEDFSAFYGVVYLSEEFETPTMAQTVGSLNIEGSVIPISQNAAVDKERRGIELFVVC
jgi:hypothetical protein